MSDIPMIWTSIYIFRMLHIVACEIRALVGREFVCIWDVWCVCVTCTWFKYMIKFLTSHQNFIYVWNIPVTHDPVHRFSGECRYVGIARIYQRYDNKIGWKL